MRKQLYDGLVAISDDMFHRLCDAILEHYNSEYSNLGARGMHPYMNKPVKSQPDSFKLLTDGSIYAFQYTTTSNKGKLRKKLLSDIEEIHNWDLGLNVRRIVLCCNSKLWDDLIEECKGKCSEYGWEMDLLDIDSIISIIVGSYDAKVKVNDYFPFDVFSINLEADLRYYIENEYPSEAAFEIIDNYHRKLLKFDIYALDLKAVFALDSTELDFNIKQNVALTGGAGAGKSTFMKRWFLDRLKNIEYQAIPVLCELRTYSGEYLPDFIKENLEIGLNQIDVRLVNKLLLEGHFQIFFDGLDELSGKYLVDFKIKCLSNIKYSKNMFIISSRDFDKIQINDRFLNYSIQPLDEKAVMSFVLCTIPNKSDIVLDFCKNNSGIMILLSNPFNLIVIVSIIQSLTDHKAIINFLMHSLNKKHYFYNKLIRQIMIWNREILTNYDLREEFLIHLVSYIAYRVLNDWKIKMDIRFFNSLITDMLNEYSLNGQVNVENVRDCIISCKFIQNVSGFYQFEHNNLLDYFVSLYIFKNKDNSELLTKVFKHPAMTGPLLLAF